MNNNKETQEHKYMLTHGELRIALAASLSHQLKRDFTVNSVSGVIIRDRITNGDLAIDFADDEKSYETMVFITEAKRETPVEAPVEVIASIERAKPATALDESVANVNSFLDSLG